MPMPVHARTGRKCRRSHQGWPLDKLSLLVFWVTFSVCLQAAQLPVPLNSAGNFTVLGASTVTNTGPTIVYGNLGVSPGSAVTGFPPGTVTGGAIHVADPTAATAQETTGAGRVPGQGPFILDGGHFVVEGARGIPKRVGFNAVTVGVGAGADGGVAGRGLGVGVIEVAIGEPGAFFHEEIEAASLELGAVADQVIAAELVDDHDDDQFGLANVGLGRSGSGEQGGQKRDEAGEQGSKETGSRLHGTILYNWMLQGVQTGQKSVIGYLSIG